MGRLRRQNDAPEALLSAHRQRRMYPTNAISKSTKSMLSTSDRSPAITFAGAPPAGKRRTNSVMGLSNIRNGIQNGTNSTLATTTTTTTRRATTKTAAVWNKTKAGTSAMAKGKNRKTVSFGQVDIREHARILGDHPCCPDGLALAIDWKHAEHITSMKVDSYEHKKIQQQQQQEETGKRTTGSNRTRPTSSSSLTSATGLAKKLSPIERRSLLRKIGNYDDGFLIDAYYDLGSSGRR